MAKSHAGVKLPHSSSTVVSELKHSTGIYSLDRSQTGDIWLFDHKQHISIVDDKGHVKKKVELEKDIYGMSVSPVTGNVWITCEDSGVYEILDKIPTERITTDTSCWTLCVTPDDNLLVGTKGKVTRYNAAGEIMQSSEKNSIVHAYHLAVSSNSGNIAVCDDDRLCWGGKDKPHVTILDSELQLNYQYYGPPKSEYSRSCSSKFNPQGTVYDSQGRLLVADHENKCIQLINEYGQFLKVIHYDELKPKALTLIQDGMMFVGFENSVIKMIRYVA